MKTATQLLLLLLTLASTIHALALPTYITDASHLFKRKGGGGGGGRGGGGSSSSGSRGSSSSGSSSSGRSGGTAGVGPQPRTYSGGAYYGGGSARPYKSGSASPGGINPRIVGAGALGGVAFLGLGVYAYGAYAYPYGGYYHYYNETARENNTRPAECFCGRYSQCGCEQRNETDYVNSVANNQSIAQVADVNGTDTLVINGNLPNDTTVAEASGAVALRTVEMGGWAVLGGAVVVGVLML